MDCFYAQVEILDRPELIDKPVAVGGPRDRRGVLCTCNYVARGYGVRSAMSTNTAYRHCPELIVLPVDMQKYRAVARRIHAIFHEFTDKVEPLSLDEAYLDVSHSEHFQGSATLIAEAIRKKIWTTENLTASAGVAPNKFLAKVASAWNKPNGLFVIKPHEIEAFIKNLPVEKLWGVGKVTAQKLHDLNLKTCADLQAFSLFELTELFGKLGYQLYEQCRGQDRREVEPNRIRKSLSVEETFLEDITHPKAALDIIHKLYQLLLKRLQTHAPERSIKNQYLKVKFSDFKQSSAEVMSSEVQLGLYLKLFREHYTEAMRPIRLLGLGVHFNETGNSEVLQQDLFAEFN